jgi:hypothetical protein
LPMPRQACRDLSRRLAATCQVRHARLGSWMRVSHGGT